MPTFFQHLCVGSIDSNDTGMHRYKLEIRTGSQRALSASRCAPFRAHLTQAQVDMFNVCETARQGGELTAISAQAAMDELFPQSASSSGRHTLRRSAAIGTSTLEEQQLRDMVKVASEDIYGQRFDLENVNILLPTSRHLVPGGAFPGLCNWGNTCPVNVVLQTLMHVQSIRCHLKDISVSHPNQLARELGIFARSYCVNGHSRMSPLAICLCLCRESGNFVAGEQNDAAEVFATCIRVCNLLPMTSTGSLEEVGGITIVDAKPEWTVDGGNAPLDMLTSILPHITHWHPALFNAFRLSRKFRSWRALQHHLALWMQTAMPW